MDDVALVGPPVSAPGSLPDPAEGARAQPTLLEFDPIGRLTHRLFRFPAKIHPAAARHLIHLYSSTGQTVFDPFVGSGTTLLEGLVAGCRVIGSDVDPLAIAVTLAKTTVLDPASLRTVARQLLDKLEPHRRSGESYDNLVFTDIDRVPDDAQAWIPAIPNLSHWFRRYVTVDLARIRATIATVPCTPQERHFVSVVFASIVRSASNADPVPVSGLEVTAHMRRLEARGRRIDPFALFERALARAIDDMAQLAKESPAGGSARVFMADATRLPMGAPDVQADLILTSPPYHGAVDYYRRHQLEMYWLGLTATHDDRLRLLDKYVGRPKVPQTHRLTRGRLSGADLRA
ncbi:MAG: DNA methyltransferase, partial [Candidatus Limnocylindrales bacterium]